MKKKTSSPQDSAPQLSPVVPLLLLCLSAGMAMLSLFQWMELLVLQAGGTAVCELSSTVSCATVWSSPFAAAVHRTLGMPVAGLGLVYGALTFALSIWFTARVLKEKSLGMAATALRLCAGLGVLSCLVFVAASVAAGALCLTCLATYALTAGFAVVAFRLVPLPLHPSTADLKGALIRTVALGAAAYLLALPAGLGAPKAAPAAGSLGTLPTATVPAANTPSTTVQAPSPSPVVAPPPVVPETREEAELANYLRHLPATEQLMVSRAIADYRQEKPQPDALPAARFQYGPKGAPLRIVEWTDIRCGHCKALVEAMEQVKRVAPAGSFSVEPRHFPLDGTCNPTGRPGPGTSCIAAKAQICLEGASDFWTIRDRMFEEQANLTPDRVLEIASSGSMSIEQLLLCLAKPETEQKLKQDIDLALQFKVEGTPLVVLNGRKSLPVPSFLYALAAAHGNAQSQAFAVLPPPPDMPKGDDHAGHAH